MATKIGNTTKQASTSQGQPQYPTRKWYQHIPGLGKGYEDQLARYQNDYNLWMWNKENKYNSPASQVDRWSEAGLSTNLMYGQGNSGNAGSATPAERSNVGSDGPGISNVIERFMDTRMKLAQVKDVESAAKLKDAQSTDLLRDIDAKDTNWSIDKYGQPFDIKNMSQRDREAYSKSIQEMHKMTSELHRAKGAQAQASILKKIDTLKNSILIMQMVSGGLGAIARFK
jgi:hypothetical protein